MSESGGRGVSSDPVGDRLPQAAGATPEESAAFRTFLLWQDGLRYTYRILFVLSSGLPFFFAYKMVEAVAGRTTSVQVTLAFTVSVVFNLLIGGATATLWWTKRQQGKELRRVRARLTMAEKRSGEYADRNRTLERQIGSLKKV